MYIDIDTLGFAPVRWFEQLKKHDGVNGKWTPVNEEMTIGEIWKANCSFKVLFTQAFLVPGVPRAIWPWNSRKNQDALLHNITKSLREHKENHAQHKYPL